MRERWSVQYLQRVLATDPIALWVQDEKQGNVAYDLVSTRIAGAQNGAITGCTLGEPGIGDGRTSFFYDGANDFTDIISASLIANFNGNSGGASIWARVTNAGVWADGQSRCMLRLVDLTGQNEIAIPKHTGANQLRWRTKRNNVFVGTVTAQSSIDRVFYSISWDASGFYLYQGGASLGFVPLAQPWSNPLVFAFIGSISAVPLWPWDGWLSYGALYDYTVPQSVWQDLAVVQ